MLRVVYTPGKKFLSHSLDVLSFRHIVPLVLGCKTSAVSFNSYWHPCASQSLQTDSNGQEIYASVTALFEFKLLGHRREIRSQMYTLPSMLKVLTDHQFGLAVWVLIFASFSDPFGQFLSSIDGREQIVAKKEKLLSEILWMPFNSWTSLLEQNACQLPCKLASHVKLTDIYVYMESIRIASYDSISESHSFTSIPH